MLLHVYIFSLHVTGNLWIVSYSESSGKYNVRTLYSLGHISLFEQRHSMSCSAEVWGSSPAVWENNGYLFHQVILVRLELGNWYFKTACSSNMNFHYGDKMGGHLCGSINAVNKCWLKSGDCRFCFYVQIFQLGTYRSLSKLEKPRKYWNRLPEKLCSLHLWKFLSPKRISPKYFTSLRVTVVWGGGWITNLLRPLPTWVFLWSYELEVILVSAFYIFRICRILWTEFV